MKSTKDIEEFFKKYEDFCQINFPLFQIQIYVEPKPVINLSQTLVNPNYIQSVMPNQTNMHSNIPPQMPNPMMGNMNMVKMNPFDMSMPQMQTHMNMPSNQYNPNSLISWMSNLNLSKFIFILF